MEVYSPYAAPHDPVEWINYYGDVSTTLDLKLPNLMHNYFVWSAVNE